MREAVKQGASDIHMKVGVPPYVRIHGTLSPFGQTGTPKEDMDRIVASMVPEEMRERINQRTEVDLAVTIPGVARFRCNIFKQRGTFELVLRVVPYNIPTMEQLGLPSVLKLISMEPRGLVLVTGITGSGKSTTIASMIQHINENLPVHIVTIEDPIEFVYRDVKASISQREVGIDTQDFYQALKYVLRQDPDVIVLGEMRDRDTAITAIMAAETGHLVMSTLHTADAIQTVDRIIDMFPAAQHEQIRHGLASTLRAIISMRLLPKADGKGRAPAIEIMINTPAIRSLLMENKLGEIKSLISEGASQYGMQTFDQSLLQLYKAKLITKESALEEATSAAELELAMKGITSGSGSSQSFIRSGQSDFQRQRAKEYYTRARRLFEQGLIEDASREIRRALVDDPESGDAKELLGKIEEAQKKEGIKAEAEPYVKRGLELVGQDKIEEALAVFRQGLQVDPNNDRLKSMIKAAEEKGSFIKGTKALLADAQTQIREGKFPEARATLQQVLEKDPGHADALGLLSEVMTAQTRQQILSEIEALSGKAEAAFGEKRWFDAIFNWNLVRELQPEHPKASGRINEAAGQLRAHGVPGMPAPGEAPWVESVMQSFRKGLDLFMSGQLPGCLNEWRQGLSKAPQAKGLLETYQHKVEALHAEHVKYHLDRAGQLWEQGEVGRAMSQLRHSAQIEPGSAEVKAQLDAHKPAADQMVDRYIGDADKWQQLDRVRAAVFCLERAFEIDPAKNGLKQKVTEGRNRLAKLKDIITAMDKKVA